jgi:hypothetical protein
MTVETISSSFRATGLVPFNLERVLENLSPIIEATPSLRSCEDVVGRGFEQYLLGRLSTIA